MTIVRHLPQQLILAHAPWATGGFLIACIIACAGAVLGLVFAGETAGLLTLLVGSAIPLLLFVQLVRRDQVIFDAARGTITLQRRSLWHYESDEHALSVLLRADLQEIAETARPVLVFTDDRPPVPLVKAYLSGNGPRQAAQTITLWLQDWRSNRQKGLGNAP